MLPAELCDSKTNARRCTCDERCITAFENGVGSHCKEEWSGRVGEASLMVWRMEGNSFVSNLSR